MRGIFKISGCEQEHLGDVKRSYQNDLCFGFIENAVAQHKLIESSSDRA
jgi:hypothetical protein